MKRSAWFTLTLFAFFAVGCLSFLYGDSEEKLESLTFDTTDLKTEGLNDLILARFQEIFRGHLKVYSTEKEDDVAKKQIEEGGELGTFEIGGAIAYISSNETSSTFSLTLKIISTKSMSSFAISTYDLSISEKDNVEKLNIAIGNIACEVLEQVGIALSASEVAVLKGERKDEDVSSIEKNEEIKMMDDRLIVYEEYAKKARSLSLKAMDPLGKINVVEKKKETILLMRRERDESISSFKARIEGNAKEDCEKIDSVEWKVSELTADKRPAPRAVKERAEKKRRIMNEASLKIDTYEKTTIAKEEAKEKEILQDIAQNYKIMASRNVLDSVSNPEIVRFRIGNYDGEKYGWVSNIEFELGEARILNYSILIPYKALFNKKPQFNSKEYQDNVEEYDSYFRSNIPVVYASVEYCIEPSDRRWPSSYIIKILSTNIYKVQADQNGKTRKLISDKKLLTGLYVCDDIYDIRSVAEKKEDEAIEAAKLARIQKLEDKRTAKILWQEEKERARREPKMPRELSDTERKAREFFSPARYYGFAIGLQGGTSFDIDSARLYATLDLPIWPIFLGIESTASMSKTQLEDGSVNRNNFIESIDPSKLNMNYGLRLGIHCLGYNEGMIAPYLCASGGVNYDFPTKEITGYVKGTFGIHMLYFFDINYEAEYNINKRKLVHLFGLSIGFNMPANKQSLEE